MARQRRDWTTRTTTPSSACPRTASQADIKKAFRKLARQHHPDAKPGDTAAERRFKEVNEANEVLSDPAKRKQYDELGANWEAISRARAGRRRGRRRAPFGGFAGFGGPGGNVRYEFRTSGDPGEFSDFFRMFFGEEARRRGGSPSTGGRGSRPTGGLGFDDILSGMGHRRPRDRSGRRRPRSRPVPPPTHEAEAEITPRRGLPRHDPAGRGRRQAARDHDPAPAPTPAPGSS